MASAARGRYPSRRRRRGLALLVVLLVLVVAGSGLFLAIEPGDSAAASERSRSASEALAAARSALVAHALSATDAAGDVQRPGALPCPDQDAPGDAGAGASQGAACAGSDVHLGRLPHRTLDIPDPGDDLWLAISVDLLNDGTNTINPDEVTDPLTLDGAAGHAAVLAGPGPPLGAPSGRPSSDADDYLEGDNADGDVDFADCAAVDACNDRLIGITLDQLFDPVRERLLARVEERLIAYHDANGRLPFAHDASQAAQPCREGVRQGRLPLTQGDCVEPGSFIDPCALPRWVRPENDSFFSCTAGADGGHDWLRLLTYRINAACTGGSGTCEVELVADNPAIARTFQP